MGTNITTKSGCGPDGFQFVKGARGESIDMSANRRQIALHGLPALLIRGRVDPIVPGCQRDFGVDDEVTPAREIEDNVGALLAAVAIAFGAVRRLLHVKLLALAQPGFFNEIAHDELAPVALALGGAAKRSGEIAGFLGELPVHAVQVTDEAFYVSTPTLESLCVSSTFLRNSLICSRSGTSRSSRSFLLASVKALDFSSTICDASVWNWSESVFFRCVEQGELFRQVPLIDDILARSWLISASIRRSFSLFDRSSVTARIAFLHKIRDNFLAVGIEHTDHPFALGGKRFGAGSPLCQFARLRSLSARVCQLRSQARDALRQLGFFRSDVLAIFSIRELAENEKNGDANNDAEQGGKYWNETLHLSVWMCRTP